MNLSGLFGGGSPQQNTNPFNPNQGNDYNPWDPASFQGSYGDPLQQAQNTVSPPSNIDPSTGQPTTPGGGSQSGTPQQPIAQALLRTLDPNMRMQAGGGPNNIQQTGPVQGPGWIQPQTFRNPTNDPNYREPGDPSAWGGPNYAGSGYGYTPVPQPHPRRTTTMQAPGQADQPPIDPSTLPNPAAGYGGASEPPNIYGGSASPDEREIESSGLRPSAPGPGTPTPEMLKQPDFSPYNPAQDPFGAGQSISGPSPQGGGATGSWTDAQPQPPQSSEIGRALGGTTQDPGTTTPSPAATPPRDTTMQTSGGPAGQGGQPLTPEQYRQQYDPNSGMVPPDQYEQLYNQRFGQGGQGGPGGQQFNPIQMLMDFLFGGPQALMQDLQGLSRQVPGGYNYGDQGDQGGYRGGYMGGTEAPWLLTGGRAPPGTDPSRYAPATQQQIEDYRRTGSISPQSSKISGEKGPTPVMTTREPGPTTATGTIPANTMPTTPGGRLDPITAATAGGGGLTGGLPYGATRTAGVSPNAVMNVRPGDNAGQPVAKPGTIDSLRTSGPGGPEGMRHPDAQEAGRGGANNTGIPNNVITEARRVARMGPGSLAQYMASQGHPKSGAWCGEFAAAVMHSQGIPVPDHPEVASNWRKFGTPSKTPQAGYVAINPISYKDHRSYVPTGSIGAHVATITSVSPDGRTMTIVGGNQGHRTETVSTRGWEFRAPPTTATASRFAEGMGLSPTATPSELLANRAYEHRPGGWGGGVYDQFRRSGDVEDRRGENPNTDFARGIGQQWVERSAIPTQGPLIGSSYADPADYNDPMSQALGIGDIGALYRRGPRRLRERSTGPIS